MRLKKFTMLVCLSISFFPSVVPAQDSKYPPLSEYMMERNAEIALAESAAPPNISDRAKIEVLTAEGYKVARAGDNGFVCLVMRGWTAPTFTPAKLRDLVYDPTLRAPICFDPVASRTVLPYYELRSRLGMQTKHRQRLLKRSRQPTQTVRYRSARLFLSHICGPQTKM